MALINKPYTFSAGASIVASEHNSNFDTVYNCVNGSISNANIDTMAAITDSKLAQITTAGKVSGAAITLLTSVPSGAGILPIANIASGTATGSKFVRDDGTLQVPTQTLTAGMLVQEVMYETGAVATGTGVIPYDDTIPQNGEGDEYMTLAITPTSASNMIIIDVTWIGAISSNGDLLIALFQDSTASAIAGAVQIPPVQNTMQTISFAHKIATVGTTSSTTFKVRAGASAAATTTLNGFSAARKLGGVCASSIRIREIKV